MNSLRRATAKELVPGGVWYRKESNGHYSTVITAVYDNPEKMAAYRAAIQEASEQGKIYIRRDKPHHPLSKRSEVFFKPECRMPKLIMYNKTKGDANKSHAAKLAKELGDLPDGNYVITIRSNDIKGNPRGKYFAILKVVATDTGMEINELHEMFKNMFNEGDSTNKFVNDKEWSDYINKVKAFIETNLGVSLPNPRDMTYEQWMQIEHEYDKSFKF